MKIGILKEPEIENRVALLPDQVKKLKSENIHILFEKGAGKNAFASDADYKEAGAEVVSRKYILENAEMILGIHLPAEEEINALKQNQILIFVINPLVYTESVRILKDKGLTAFSLDIVPRITRAQDKDILSSMATVSGYKAVLDAALALPRFFPMFMTAAGTIRPAKVLVLGAGVAGLQAIATARRLGAQVEAFDVRSEVKEQVHSLGAKFVEVEGAREDKSAGGYAVEQTEEYKQKQQQLVQEHAKNSNVVITTAQIPGRKAPVLITRETVENMSPGSVIVDLAADSGGNCEVTEKGKNIVFNQVRVLGKTDYPSTMPIDASHMYGNNLINFLKLLISKKGELTLDFDDEILKQSCVSHHNEILSDRVKKFIEKL